MRKVRYQVACSLDGYIARRDGSYDWIVIDPDIDFAGLFAQFDTLLMGRRTYALVQAAPEQYQGMRVIVFSRTLQQRDHPAVTIVSDDIRQTIDDLRAQPGKDIWVFGGGELFASLLALGCVDTVEPAVIPVLLGDGIPMLPSPGTEARLKLTRHTLYPKTGTILLEYDVVAANS